MEENKMVKSADNRPEENRMGTEPVHGLLLKMSLPLMLSMFVQSMYNIVDSIFVSRICEDALTAVSLCFPIQSMMLAFSIGTAVGISALISRYLGAKQFDRVDKIVRNGIFVMACTYVLFFIFGLIGYKFIALQIKDPLIIQYGGIYLRVVCWLSFGMLMVVLMERFLQATGRTAFIFVVQVSGAIINIILDPILIFGLLGAPKMGVAGAALATVIGQCFGAGLGLFFNKHMNSEIHMSMKGFKPDMEIIRSIYQIGLPSIIMQSVGSVMVFGLNQILVVFTKTAVATFGVYFKLQTFVFMPVFGLNNGVVPIAAYNYGAGNRSRLNQAMHIGTRYAIVFMSIGMILFWVIPDVLLGFFSASDQMLEMGRVCLRVLSLAFPLAAFSIMRGSIFQALGKSTYSMYISIVRQLVVLLPVAFFISKLGVLDYVWLAFPIAEVVGMSMSIYYSRSIRKNIIDKM